MKIVHLRAKPNREGITPVRYTLLDDDDFENIKRMGLTVFRSSSKHGNAQIVVSYARVNTMGRIALLHRFLIGEPADMTVDHINRETFDNRR